MPPLDTQIVNAIIAHVFRIEEVTAGDPTPRRGERFPAQPWVLRYRGELTIDSISAYDQLAADLGKYDLTPLFRIEEGRQTILLMQGTLHPKPGKAWVNILLFALTLVSVLFTGTLFSYNGPTPQDASAQIWSLFTHLWSGWPFAVSLLSILLAHEFGHYFAGRKRGAAVSLPYFIPFPFSLLGTMGAFIQLKSLPKNKRSLFDLAIAGPLAGLVVAIPVLLIGLARSPVQPTQDSLYTRSTDLPDVCATDVPMGSTYSCPDDNLLEGNSLLYLGLKYLVKGQLLPSPLNYDIPRLAYWARYLLTGHPLPIGGLDVMVDPVAWAGWAGLLVTFLNLIPAGQLDGGHILYAVLGRRIRKVFPFILVATLALGFFWSGWWLWSFLLFFLVGRTHAEPLDQITQLDKPRKMLAWLMLVVFLLVLMPVPLVTF